MTTRSQSPAERALAAAVARIDERDVVELALALGNLDSPTGSEGAASDYVFEWLEAAGFAPRRVALLPDRSNIVARVRGSEAGRSLMFNSHLDTTIAREEVLTTPRAGAREYHEAWREGDRLIGNGIVNNKGVMATWMVACKALRDAGVELAGDLLLTMVVGEIGVEPVDEFQSPEYLAKEAGARFIVNRGVTADYAVVAEGTSFGLCWVEAGKAFFRVDVLGHEPPLYTPYLPRPTSRAESPNAIIRATEVIEAIEQWAGAIRARAHLPLRGRHGRAEGEHQRDPQRRSVQDHQDPIDLPALHRCQDHPRAGRPRGRARAARGARRDGRSRL